MNIRNKRTTNFLITGAKEIWVGYIMPVFTGKGKRLRRGLVTK